MEQLLIFGLSGVVTAALYAVAASGLVLTYTTSGIFNFAHGATGMFAAFTYWKLRYDWGWPAPVAIIAVLFVLAPLFGVALERGIMRGLHNVSEVTKLVVTVSLLFGVFQSALILFPPGEARNMRGFFSGESLDIGLYGISLTYHDVITIAAAVAVAVGLRFLLFSTRAGLAMRSVVDDRDLTQLNGGRAATSSMLSWALGTMLAALAGILQAGALGGLNHVTLTLLVVNAYAAALFGRLRSLPLTFVGALALGLMSSFAIGYLSLEPITSILGQAIQPAMSLAGFGPAIPALALFVVLLFLPALRVKAAGQQASREVIPKPPVLRWVGITVVVAIAAFLWGTVFDGIRTFQLGQGLALAIVMLSLVPLTGYAGQISLAPMAFAGVGAVVMGNWGDGGSILGLILAALVTAVVGAVVALPALRLQGLYLALATSAFAVVMDFNFFNQTRFMPNGSLAIDRLDLGPSFLDFGDDRAHLVLLAVVFGLVAMGVVALRRGEFGRRLLAMKSSEAACATLGVNLTTTKVQVFALSAGIAGLGGALFGAQLNSVSPDQFRFLQSLPIVLLAVIGGIGSAGGALFGGIAYAFAFYLIPDQWEASRNFLSVAPALAGVSLGRNPNGAVNETVRSFREIQARRTSGGSPGAAMAAEDRTVIDLDREDLADAAARARDRALLDAETGLAEEPLYRSFRALARAGRDG